MTTPARANKRSKGGPRTYSWPPQPPYEFEVISVTSAVEGGLPKPYLVGWAAKEAAICAVDDFDVVKLMLERGDEQGAINHIKGAPFRKRDAAGNRGTIVHSAIEAYLAGKRLTKDEIEEEMKQRRVTAKQWKPTLAMVKAMTDFMYDEEPEVYWSEKTVFNRTHGYAGTPDIIGRMRVGGTMLPVVIDCKTSKSIYDETAYQLTAYARAEFVGTDDGQELPLLPTDEKIEWGVIVRPQSNGKYEKAYFTLTDDLFERFIHMVGVASTADIEQASRRP